MKKILITTGMVLFAWISNAHAQLDFGKLVNPGPLSSPHSTLEGIKNCTTCHATSNGVPDEKCLTCHKEISERIDQHKGYHARVSGTCVSCHSEHKGKDYDITGLSRLQFDHTETGWPLTGKHADMDCPKCHTKSRKSVATGQLIQRKTYLGNNSACSSCHKSPHQNKKALFQQCYKCHDTNAWEKRDQPNFNHSKETKFALTGSHEVVDCIKCHTKKVWAPIPMACVNCHADPHDGQFGKTCNTCHNTQSFKSASAAAGGAAGAAAPGVPVKGAAALKGGKGAAAGTGQSSKLTAGFDHAKTQFPLTGKHKAVTCKSCHGPVIGKMDNFQDCVGCHKNPHGTQFQARWTNKACSDCHSTEGFRKLKFNHNQDSRFEILGKHKLVKCASCHTKGRFRWLDSTPDCKVCHADPHKGQFEPKPCASCHNYDGFKMSKSAPSTLGAKTAGVPTSSSAMPSMAGFNHDQTGFPLVGRHQAVTCDNCHVGGKFKDIGRACNSCHNDFHKGELGFECERCHSPMTSFNDVEFNHNREAKFRIDGAHVKNECNQCHWNNKYKFGDFSCSTCHIDIHKGSFGPNCDRCHTTTGFKLAEGFHNFGSFRITGVHNKIDCVTCHNPKAPARARPMECSSCHKDPHMGSLSQECSTCHGQTAWMPTTFRHNQTGFELSGAHRFLTCDSCHKNRIFGGLPNECFFCHFKDFNASLPQHVGAPTTCNTCHYTFGFRPAKQ